MRILRSMSANQLPDVRAFSDLGSHKSAEKEETNNSILSTAATEELLNEVSKNYFTLHRNIV